MQLMSYNGATNIRESLIQLRQFTIVDLREHLLYWSWLEFTEWMAVRSLKELYLYIGNNDNITCCKRNGYWRYYLSYYVFVPLKCMGALIGMLLPVIALAQGAASAASKSKYGLQVILSLIYCGLLAIAIGIGLESMKHLYLIKHLYALKWQYPFKESNEQNVPCHSFQRDVVALYGVNYAIAARDLLIRRFFGPALDDIILAMIDDNDLHLPPDYDYGDNECVSKWKKLLCDIDSFEYDINSYA